MNYEYIVTIYEDDLIYEESEGIPTMSEARRIASEQLDLAQELHPKAHFRGNIRKETTE